MQADFAVELGKDDPQLEMPWSGPEGAPRYYDIKRHPELLLMIEEAAQNRDLGEFLAVMNSPITLFETAKCDAWLTDELTDEEEIFGATWKFGSYVDLLFADDTRYDFPKHEAFAASASKLLGRAPEISAAAEFVVRRCWFHAEEAREGFYLTFYLYGYGDDEDQARQRWAIALKVVQNALIQLSAASRRQTAST
jgi:hypothetical protein